MNGCVNAFTNMKAPLNIPMVEFLTMDSILADSKDGFRKFSAVNTFLFESFVFRLP